MPPRTFSIYLLSVFCLGNHVNCYSASSWEVVVAAQNTADIINVSTNETTTISAPSNFSVPALSPDAKTAYITDASGISGLAEINLANNAITATIPSLGIWIAISPDGSTAYLSTDTNSIIKIDLATQAVTTATSGIFGANQLAVSTDGTQLFITSSDTSITVYDTATFTQIAFSPIQIPTSAISIAVTPDGTQIVAGTVTKQVYIIDIATHHLVDSITINDPDITSSGLMIVSPDGLSAYFTGYNSAAVPFIYPIDLTTGTLGTRFQPSTQNGSGQLAITPDSNTLFVGAGGNLSGDNIIRIDQLKTTPTVTATIPLTGFVPNLAVTPDQAPTAAFTYSSNGGVVTFDASASSSPVGSIASYAWNFGDGSPIQTVTTPTITHSLIGPYNVTLTVTNTGNTSTTQTYTGQVVGNNGGPSAQLTKLVIGASFNTTGTQVVNRFLSEREYANVLNWSPPTNTQVATYALYRDSAFTDLIAVVPGNTPQYIDHNRVKGVTYTYYIVARNSAGQMNGLSSVTVAPKK